MLAVKLVVHGLVEFIQNFSKKSHDTPQVSPQFYHIYTRCEENLRSIPDGKLLVEPQPGFIAPAALKIRICEVQQHTLFLLVALKVIKGK